MSLEIPLYGDDYSVFDETETFGGESDSESELSTTDAQHSSQDIQLSSDELKIHEENNSLVDSDTETSSNINPQTQNGSVIQNCLQQDIQDSDKGVQSNDENPDDCNFIDYEGRGSKFLDQNPPKWTEDVKPITVHPFTGPDPGPKLPDNWDNNSGPLEYFKLLFPDDLAEKIAQYTNQYATHSINLFRKVSPNYVDQYWSLDGSDNVTKEEILAFLGANIVFGLNPCKRLKAAFSTDPYVNNQGVRSHFTLKRFLKIGSYFCCCNKSEEKPKGHKNYDKLYKVKELIQHCNTVFPKYFQFSGHVALDESMIKTKSRIDNLVYNPQKPVRRGIKVYSLCDSKDPRYPYLLHFEPYMGETYHKKTINGKTFETVKRMTKPLFGTYACLYVDNYYTSVPLFCHLLKNKVYCIGTLRHRKGLPPQLRKHKPMVRGKHRVWQDESNRQLTCTLWQDTKLVSFLATCADPCQVTTCTRRIGGSYKKINQPLASFKYNKKFKAVDSFDYSIRNFCSGRKSVRNTKYYITFCFDAIVTNAYILYMMTSTQEKSKTYSQMYFRLELGKQLMSNFTCRSYQTPVPCMFIGPDQENLDMRNHFHGKLKNVKGPRVCRGHKKNFGSTKRTRLGCVICNISLCYKCHYMYHNPDKIQS